MGPELQTKREIWGLNLPDLPKITKQNKMPPKWLTHQNKFSKHKLKFTIHEN